MGLEIMVRVWGETSLNPCLPIPVKKWNMTHEELANIWSFPKVILERSDRCDMADHCYNFSNVFVAYFCICVFLKRLSCYSTIGWCKLSSRFGVYRVYKLRHLWIVYLNVLHTFSSKPNDTSHLNRVCIHWFGKGICLRPKVVKTSIILGTIIIVLSRVMFSL